MSTRDLFLPHIEPTLVEVSQTASVVEPVGSGWAARDKLGSFLLSLGIDDQRAGQLVDDYAAALVDLIAEAVESEIGADANDDEIGAWARRLHHLKVCVDDAAERIRRAAVEESREPS